MFAVRVNEGVRLAEIIVRERDADKLLQLLQLEILPTLERIERRADHIRYAMLEAVGVRFPTIIRKLDQVQRALIARVVRRNRGVVR